MQLHLKLIGVILIFLSLIHLVFPKYFQWKKDLISVTLINKQLMYVHTFFIGLIIFLMGVCCIYSTEDLMYTRLGRQLSFGLFIFWCTRLVFQFFVYSPKLWRGKLFESFIHVTFSMIWIYFSIVFFLVFRND